MDERRPRYMSTGPDRGVARPDPDLGAVMSERHQLINLAYRLLGSLTEAEDVVQETYARWYAMSAPQQAAIDSPGRWLTTVASRICLDLSGSAAGQRPHRPGRPRRQSDPRRVGEHGLPRRPRIDDPGRACRLHAPRRLRLPL